MESCENGVLIPEKATSFSMLTAWQFCEKGHTDYAGIASRVRSSSDCLYCSNRWVLIEFNDLARVESKMIAQCYPGLNGDSTPQMVGADSYKKVWRQCNDEYVWRAVVYSRTGDDPNHCPVCAGRRTPVREACDRAVPAENRLSKRIAFALTENQFLLSIYRDCATIGHNGIKMTKEQTPVLGIS